MYASQSKERGTNKRSKIRSFWDIEKKNKKCFHFSSVTPAKNGLGCLPIVSQKQRQSGLDQMGDIGMW